MLFLRGTITIHDFLKNIQLGTYILSIELKHHIHRQVSPTCDLASPRTRTKKEHEPPRGRVHIRSTHALCLAAAAHSPRRPRPSPLLPDKPPTCTRAKGIRWASSRSSACLFGNMCRCASGGASLVQHKRLRGCRASLFGPTSYALHVTALSGRCRRNPLE